MKIDKNERDAAILDVVYNGGYPITQIVSKEYLEGIDTFAEPTKQFINKYGHVAITLKGSRDLTLRTLQDILEYIMIGKFCLSILCLKVNKWLKQRRL